MSYQLRELVAADNQVTDTRFQDLKAELGEGWYLVRIEVEYNEDGTVDKVKGMNKQAGTSWLLDEVEGATITPNPDDFLYQVANSRWVYINGRWYKIG